MRLICMIKLKMNLGFNLLLSHHSLEENEGFCNCKEQLVFRLHWTFAIRDNLEAPNCDGQVTCQTVVIEWNGLVSHPTAYLELRWWAFMTWLLMWYLLLQLNQWVLWLVCDSFAISLQLICDFVATHLGLCCNLYVTSLQFICDLFATCRFVDFKILILMICRL